MKLKQLVSLLQEVKPFAEPKIRLEQYPTTAHLAANMLFSAAEAGDIEDRIVVDLGSGCGILGIAAALLGARQVIGFEIDPDAIEIARQNCEALEVDIHYVNIDVEELEPKTVMSLIPEWDEDVSGDEHDHDNDDAEDKVHDSKVIQENASSRAINTVVSNPPFGTKTNPGIDMRFLQKAVELADTAVYSLHKTSTRQHILKVAKEWGVDIEVSAEMKFDIPAMYKFHKQKSVDIEVDFLHLFNLKK